MQWGPSWEFHTSGPFQKDKTTAIIVMNLPVNPPVLPMLAKRVGELPSGETWIFEPKWDGFRALVFRDGDEIFIQSRDEKPLNRYFPEL
jgi:ATP-dependent DNA ligase